MTSKSLYGALAKAQAEMTGATKDSDNPHFRSKYADLGAVQDACLPALNKHGFAVFQPVVTDETGHWVETILAHEGGETISCRVPLLLGKHDMQGLGSAITYARRYGLMCMSGVAPEDDDGNKAAEQGGKHEPRRRATSKADDDRWAPPDEEGPPLVDEKHVAQEVAKIKSITSVDELKSYWSALVNAQPYVARDARVVNAKDECKAALLKAEKEAA